MHICFLEALSISEESLECSYYKLYALYVVRFVKRFSFRISDHDGMQKRS
jgi:hypothetical protein